MDILPSSSRVEWNVKTAWRWRWRPYDPSKLREPFAQRRSVASQKAGILNYISAKASKLAKVTFHWLMSGINRLVLGGRHLKTGEISEGNQGQCNRPLLLLFFEDCILNMKMAAWIQGPTRKPYSSSGCLIRSCSGWFRGPRTHLGWPGMGSGAMPTAVPRYSCSTDCKASCLTPGSRNREYRLLRCFGRWDFDGGRDVEAFLTTELVRKIPSGRAGRGGGPGSDLGLVVSSYMISS